MAFDWKKALKADVEDFCAPFLGENGQSHADAAKLAILCAQWEKGLVPLTRGPTGRFAIANCLVIDQGSEGPGWSEFADACFKKLGVKKT